MHECAHELVDEHGLHGVHGVPGVHEHVDEHGGDPEGVYAHEYVHVNGGYDGDHGHLQLHEQNADRNVHVNVHECVCDHHLEHDEFLYDRAHLPLLQMSRRVLLFFHPPQLVM